jgi:hypothetical protein
MLRIQRNLGFEGRMFLDEAEWITYCRRKPVRYIRRPRGSTCSCCGSTGSRENPLQSAHIIGFDIGVIDLGLTPDFLDSEKNIITACRRACNKHYELDLQASMRRLRAVGVIKLPKYLPQAIHNLWQATDD